MERVYCAVVQKGEQFLIIKQSKNWEFLELKSDNPKDVESHGIKAKLIKKGKPLVEMVNDDEWELQQLLMQHISGEPAGEIKWVSRDKLEEVAPQASTSLWILENC